MPTVEAVRAAIQRHNGSKTEAGKELGISRHKILRMLGAKEEDRPRRHLVIPDVQAKSDVPLEHLTWIGQYIADKRPDVVCAIGDFADMPSLSHYDIGKKSFEGRRYQKDIKAAHEAMRLLCEPFINLPDYKPRMVLTLGNHEDRITRAIDADPKLDGLMSLDDLAYERWGWEVIPYLEPIVIDGICYCHYFASGVMGRPVASARALNNKKHMSCVMGHVQKRDIDTQYNALGKRLTSIFVGACYQHDEPYLNHQGNAETWRGCWMFNQVIDGEFDEMPLSLDYLKRRYG
jgi:hypothetical protein